LFFKIVPPGTISETKFFAGTCLKNKIFCRDQKLQNGSSHHVPRIQIITKMGSGTILKNKNFAGTKNKFFFLQGPKLKRGIFAGTSAIFKPYFFIPNTSLFKILNTFFFSNKPLINIIECLEI